MAKGILNCIGTVESNERYKIYILDGKIDQIEVIDVQYEYKTKYQRWDIHMHKNRLEKVLYNIAKQHPEKFKFMYNQLKKNDEDFFEIAKKVLSKIKAEYNYV